MNAPALTAEYRKVITAKFLDKPCYTCGAKLVEGDYAATNTFSQWYSYCSRCAASFKNQVAALLNRVETAVTPLGTNVPANITAEVDKVSKYVESVLNGSTDVVTAQSAKSGLFIVLGLVEKAAATPDPLIDALTAIAATNDRDSSFARSLLQGHAKYGSLTNNQRNAAERMLTERGRKAATTHAHVQAQPLPVVEVGLYRSDDGTVRRVYKTSRQRHASRRYNGTQFVYEGTPGLRIVADGLAAGTVRLLNAVEASAFGKQIGRCFNCMSIGRPGRLSDDRSLAVGYGPDCAANNGWWYPTADEAAQILRGTLDLDAKLTQSLTTGVPLAPAPSEAETNPLIEALETGGVLLLDELDDADVYIDDDECPQCGRVLGISTSTGNSVCDNCGWGHSDTTEDDEAPVIVTEDTIVNEGDLYGPAPLPAHYDPAADEGYDDWLAEQDDFDDISEHVIEDQDPDPDLLNEALDKTITILDNSPFQAAVSDADWDYLVGGLPSKPRNVASKTASVPSEAPVRPVEAPACASCGNEPAKVSFICQDGERYLVCPSCRTTLVRRPTCPFHEG